MMMAAQPTYNLECYFSAGLTAPDTEQAQDVLDDQFPDLSGPDVDLGPEAEMAINNIMLELAQDSYPFNDQFEPADFNVESNGLFFEPNGANSFDSFDMSAAVFTYVDSSSFEL